MRTDRKSSGHCIRHIFHKMGKAILKNHLFFLFVCFGHVHTPTQTCWINLLLSAQIRTYHPLVTELPWNKNRMQGKTNITVDIKKKVIWNESLHSSDSKHELFLALSKLSALIFFSHMNIHDILVSPHFKINNLKIKIYHKCGSSATYNRSLWGFMQLFKHNIFIFIQNSPNALEAAQTHTPALWQQMVQFKARKNNLGISHAIIQFKSLHTTYEVCVC